MSAQKADYPFRPERRNRPKGSEHISGRRKIRIERPGSCVAKGPREIYDKLDLSRCVFGHNPPALKAFMSEYGSFKVPLHIWGKNGRTVDY